MESTSRKNPSWKIIFILDIKYPLKYWDEELKAILGLHMAK